MPKLEHLLREASRGDAADDLRSIAALELRAFRYPANGHGLRLADLLGRLIREEQIMPVAGFQWREIGGGPRQVNVIVWDCLNDAYVTTERADLEFDGGDGVRFPDGFEGEPSFTVSTALQTISPTKLSSIATAPNLLTPFEADERGLPVGFEVPKGAMMASRTRVEADLKGYGILGSVRPSQRFTSLQLQALLEPREREEFARVPELVASRGLALSARPSELEGPRLALPAGPATPTEPRPVLHDGGVIEIESRGEGTVL